MGYTAWAASVVSVIISFYTDTLTQILLAMGAMLDALLVILGVLFVWLLLQSAFKELVSSSSRRESSNPWNWGPGEEGGGIGIDREEDAGWTSSWVSFMEFVTKILVILAFNYMAKLMLQEWLTVGVTVSETVVILIILVLIFFLIFDEVNRVVQAHQRRVIARTAMTVIADRERIQKQRQRQSSPSSASIATITAAESLELPV